MTKLSIPKLVATMMAIWFLAASWAQFLAGFIAQMAGTETVGGQVLDPQAALNTSLGVFNWIGWIGIGFGIVFFLLSPLLRHWTHESPHSPREPLSKVSAPEAGTAIKNP